MFNSMEVTTKRHKRSMSDSIMKKVQVDKLSKSNNSPEAPYHHKLDMGELKSCVRAKNRHTLPTEVQKKLNHEILHLQKQLEDQFVVRSALEKALTNRPLSHDPMNKNSISKPAEDLIKEISVLELEVVYLEKYLLSLHRKRFQERVSTFSTSDQNSKSKLATDKRIFSEFQGPGISTKNDNPAKNSKNVVLPQDLIDNQLKESGEFSATKTILDSSIRRSHSSLSHRSDCAFGTSYHVGILSEAVNSYHSLPLTMLERVRGDPLNVTSLAEHFGTTIPNRIVEAPNWLSEEMMKSIASIYFELAEPSLINNGFHLSPISFSSSISDSLPNTCSSEERKISVFPPWMENPFTVEGSTEFSGCYSSFVEVKWICRDVKRLKRVKHILQRFRSLVSRLKKVDPQKMTHEEKLAFWINVHNSLVMHAYFVYGVANNSMKRISLVLKAAYDVGGHTISVDMIRNSILGCRLPLPGQWLQSLFFPKTKFKVRDPRKAYAINHPESRLHFALCSGSHSDPVVRIYTPKRIFQDLEAAKEDYIQTTFRVNKQHKIILPKIVDFFAKESGLNPAGLMELFEHLIPHSSRKRPQQNQHGKFWKKIEWIPHNFAFRFLLSKELVS